MVERRGWGGQKIHVIPDLDLVIVTTANSRNASQAIDTFGLLETVIFPATTPSP